MADAEMTKFLDGIVGVVEATSCERSAIWERYAGRYQVPWEQNCSGFLETVGRLDDMPVCISLNTATVGGYKILFYDPTSTVVDHRLIDKWLEANLPASARRKDSEYLNKTDATNFHNALPGPVIKAPPSPIGGEQP